MKMDQIAYYAHNAEQAHAIKSTLGLVDEPWVDDIVTAQAWVGGGDKSLSKGHLQFCYAMGTEIEILTYLEGPHWHEKDADFIAGRPFLSHHGIHLEPGEEWPAIYAPLVQRVSTFSHTNPYLIEQRRTYRYRIHDCRDTLGVYLKFIMRMEQPK